MNRRLENYLPNFQLRILHSPMGFSLIELLVSIAVGTVILLSVFNLTLISRKAASLNTGRGELTQNGRIALERISRDLRQAQILVTRLPGNTMTPNFPPPAELEFQDGHTPDTLTYIRYHLNGSALYREIAYYSFSGDPNTRVAFDIKNAQNQAPTKTILEDMIIADNFQFLRFFGAKMIFVSADLMSGTTGVHLETGILARNLPGSGN